MILSSRVKPPTEPEPTVLVIDDDREFRESLGGLLRSVGLNIQLFASVPEFLGVGRPSGPSLDGSQLTRSVVLLAKREEQQAYRLLQDIRGNTKCGEMLNYTPFTR